MERSSNSTSTKWDTLRSIFKTLSPILLVVLTILAIKNIPGLQNFVIETGPNGVRVQVDANGKLDIVRFMNEINTDRIDKDGTLTWLRENWDVFYVYDTKLVTRLIEECPDIPINIDSKTYSEHINKCEENPLIRELRSKAQQQNSPFQPPPAMQIQVGTPEKKQPPNGTAWTCFNGELENKKVLLLKDYSSRPFEVMVRGGYQCLPGRKVPDLQINSNIALDIFGRSTNKYEILYAYII